jgi:hypothetical protein
MIGTPAIATQHLTAEIVVLVGQKPQACTFRSDSSQDAFWSCGAKTSASLRQIEI